MRSEHYKVSGRLDASNIMTLFASFFFDATNKLQKAQGGLMQPPGNGGFGLSKVVLLERN